MSDAESATVEQWWPRLSIASKHAILDVMDDNGDAEIPADARAEIRALTDSETPPTHLNAAEREFIRTQGEIVD